MKQFNEESDWHKKQGQDYVNGIKKILSDRILEYSRTENVSINSIALAANVGQGGLCSQLNHGGRLSIDTLVAICIIWGIDYEIPSIKDRDLAKENEELKFKLKQIKDIVK